MYTMGLHITIHIAQGARCWDRGDIYNPIFYLSSGDPRITLFRSTTMFFGADNILHRRIFYRILSVPQNIVMDLNNVTSFLES